MTYGSVERRSRSSRSEHSLGTCSTTSRPCASRRAGHYHRATNRRQPRCGANWLAFAGRRWASCELSSKEGCRGEPFRKPSTPINRSGARSSSSSGKPRRPAPSPWPRRFITIEPWLTTGLKIPVSGVQFSPCPPFLSPAKRRNPALGLAIRHVGSRAPRGMPWDPLGPFLIADWVPVWVPVFGAIRLAFRGMGTEPRCDMLSVETAIEGLARERSLANPVRPCRPLHWPGAEFGQLGSTNEQRAANREPPAT
jgi:hypothetical protein